MNHKNKLNYGFVVHYYNLSILRNFVYFGQHWFLTNALII